MTSSRGDSASRSPTTITGMERLGPELKGLVMTYALRSRLITTLALFEAVVGVVVFAAPGLAAHLLLGGDAAPPTLTVVRLFGVALIALGVGCYAPRSHQALYGLLAYNVLVAIYLASVGRSGAGGVLLWPTVALHAGLSVLLGMGTRVKDSLRTG